MEKTPLFYAPNIGTAHILSEEESRHAVRVLRLTPGCEINLADGNGAYYKARITAAHPKQCAFELSGPPTIIPPKTYRTHIAIAPTKNIERLEWFVEKCTEIGVDEITPVVCRFSERKQLNPERLERIVVSAAKQSVRAHFPRLNPLCRFDEFIGRHAASSQRFIAHCYEDEKRLLLQKGYLRGGSCTVLIGPEGDFSREEVDAALRAGFVAVSLGGSRLRTETAGVVACHTVTLLNEG